MTSDILELAEEPHLVAILATYHKRTCSHQSNSNKVTVGPISPENLKGLSACGGMVGDDLSCVTCTARADVMNHPRLALKRAPDLMFPVYT